MTFFKKKTKRDQEGSKAMLFRRDEGAVLHSLFPFFFLGATKEPPIAFAFPVSFFFGRHTAPYGSSQDLWRILITMHQKIRLKILRAMA